VAAALLLVKYVFRMRPMGNFGARTIVQQAANGEWESMNPHYVRDMLRARRRGPSGRVAEGLAPAESTAASSRTANSTRCTEATCSSFCSG
jgi:hypothetical protein